MMKLLPDSAHLPWPIKARPIGATNRGSSKFKMSTKKNGTSHFSKGARILALRSHPTWLVLGVPGCAISGRYSRKPWVSGAPAARAFPAIWVCYAFPDDRAWGSSKQRPGLSPTRTRPRCASPAIMQPPRCRQPPPHGGQLQYVHTYIHTTHWKIQGEGRTLPYSGFCYNSARRKQGPLRSRRTVRCVRACMRA